MDFFPKNAGKDKWTFVTLKVFNRRHSPSPLSGTEKWIPPLWIAVFYLVTMAIPSPSFSSEPFKVNETARVLHLGKMTDYFEDREGSLDFNDILSGNMKEGWRKNDTENINFGYTDSAYWIRTGLINTSSQKKKFFLEIGYPPLDHVQVFLEGKNVHVTWDLGDKRPFLDRPVDNQNFVVPVVMGPGEEMAFYARIRTTSSMQFPLTLFSTRAYIEIKQIEMMIQGLYYGSMIIMVLYNFFLFLSVRETEIGRAHV
jgi:diguanylate cyclase